MRGTLQLDEEQSTGSERFIFDAFSALILLLTALAGAYFPRALSQSGNGANSKAKSMAFHMGNMLSAGVMLSAGFCHLLADSHRTLIFIGRFPISNFLAATGYIITLLADQVVQVISESQANTEKSKQENSMKGTAVSGNGSLPVSRQLELVDVEHASKPNTREGLLSAPTRREASGCDDDNDDRAAKLPLLSNGGPGSGLGASASGAGGGDEDCHNAGVKAFFGRKPLSFATAVLLACALCIHSILEGMALGAQSSMRSTEDIMIAIAAHKGLAAYALGASIVESKASAQRYWTVIGLFSMATPVGIFLGYILSEASKSRGGAAMSALASGTFLYVALMEVIPKELADGQHRLMKMSMFLLGYSLMSLLAVWA